MADHGMTLASCLFTAGLLVLLLVLIAAPALAQGPVFEAAIRLDLGPDVGQSFGSLFEVRDQAGRAILGAGFTDVVNTGVRTDRYTAQLYARPAEGSDDFTATRLPRPSRSANAHVLDLDGNVYAWSYGVDTTLRRWDQATQSWIEAGGFAGPGVQFGDGMMRVGHGVLSFAAGSVSYDGRQILAPAAEGRFHCFYYAGGLLCFFHTLPGEGGFTRVCAVPWTPASPGPVDLSQVVTMDAKYVGETPFAWGQWRGEVITCSNNGGFYVFDGKAWRVIREADKSVSFQIYSMLNFRDRFLMAQYPTGNLWEYDGASLRQLEDWPPAIAGVSRSVREAQTAVIYRGELLVGVWPWGELWRYDGERWVSMGRLFDKPSITADFAHPFEKEVGDLNRDAGTGIVINAWGQRLSGMVPWRDTLMVSTSAKGPDVRDARFTFLTDEVWEQYGSVIRLQLPGNLAATLAPTDGPTELRFTLTQDRLAIHQDGRLLGSAELPEEFTSGLRPAGVTWGSGVFGALRGKLITAATTPAL